MPAEKASYQEAAIAALTAAEAGETPPATEETPPAAEEPVAEAAEEPSEEGEGEEKPPEAEKPPEEKPKPKAEKTWEEIAREKAKNREAAKELAAEKARLARADALIAAAESGDALGLLAAAKIPWSKAAKQVLEGGRAEEPAPEKAEPQTKLEKEVAELKAELQQRRYAEAKTKFMGQIKEIGKDFKYVSGLEAEDDVFQFMDDYYRKTGEQLGDSIEESIQIACEAVERDLSKKGQRWSKVLTDTGSANKAEGKQASPSTASKQVRTLTSDTGSGPRSVNPVKNQSGPKSEADYRNDALKAFLAADTDE